MTDSAAEAEAPAKKSRKALILGVFGALLAGGGGFFVTYGGILGSPLAAPVATDGSAETEARRAANAAEAYAIVALDPILANVGARDQSRQLRFSAVLEVRPDHVAEITRLKPRIQDVLNTYLRALEMHELEEPAALLRVRAQMLRRVQIITGPDRVNDLLVMEFFLN